MIVRLTLCLVAVACTARIAAEEASAPLDFDRQVAPVLLEHCVSCHSGSRPKGGLDLTTARAAFHGGKSGPGLVAGKPGQSGIWRRVDADEMPPRKPLPRSQRDILKKWIEAGAPWGTDPLDPFRVTTSNRAGYDWWSLQPVRRPDVPSAGESTWVRNPIDRFVLARLAARGLSPSSEADRRTLLRRVTLDLLGLPPTWEEVETFLRDDRPDAYERVVERLLASPHYGERWSRHWLDVVRFGESTGFERNDPRRTAWHFRDWMIRSLNADMPFDTFCRLQIAGDVLDPNDQDALKATGYLVAGIHNTVLPNLKNLRDAAFQDELEDQVGNLGQAFLGMTIHCARCHAHKFDPIPQEDYYRVASTLSGVQHGEREVQSQEVRNLLTNLTRSLVEVEGKLALLEEPARQAVLQARRHGSPVGVTVPVPIAAWDFRKGGSDRVGSLHVQTLGGAKLTSEGLLVDGKMAFARTPGIPLRLREKTLEAWVRLQNLEQRGGGVMTIQSPEGATFDGIVYAEREPGRWLAGSDFFRRTVNLEGPAETDAHHRPVHLAIVHHADGLISAYRDGRLYGKPYRVKGPVTHDAGKAVVAFGIRHEPPGGNRMLAGLIIQARLYGRALTAGEVAASSMLPDLVSDQDLISQFAPQDRRRWESLRRIRTDIASQLKQATDRYPPIKVYTALTRQPEPTRLLNRGQVTEPGALVSPGGLRFLPHADFGLPPDAPEAERRIKLAAWITDRKNPLFPRVLVNRLWHHHFGVGLVETPNDFGFNGGRPSHPELLDWLASEFVACGYRLKSIHRLMVTSQTYRQASVVRPECLREDAENRLLWRKRPLRVEGEVLRDSLLATTGLLSREVGGQGFSDYRETSGAGTTYFEPIDPVGVVFHRRSVYRFQPRGAGRGLLDVFDCPDPAATAPRRNSTTTPLQALALWNGSFALRIADSLADRVRIEAPDDFERQVVLAYRHVLQRDPHPAERERAMHLAAEHGMAVVARVLFNLNEFLTIE